MCDRFSDLDVLDYCCGDGHPRQAAELAAHLPECPDCQEVERAVRAVVATAESSPGPSPGADRRVRAAIARAARTRRSGRRRLAAVAAGVAVLIGGGWWLTRPDANRVTLTGVSGDVVVRRDGHEWRAEPGTQLRPHDTLTVPPGGSAVVALADASRAELGASTTVEVAAPDGGPLFLREGFLDMEVAPRRADRAVRVRTPDAEAEVLGTRFSLSVAGGDTNLRVEQGRVHFTRAADRADVLVPAGHRVSVAGAGAMAPVPTRTGEVLVIVSHEKARVHWDRFNRILGDRVVGERVQRLAYRVAVKELSEVTPADIPGRPLVVVSVADYDVGLEERLVRIGLDAARVPVLCLEPLAYPALGMTGPILGRDFGFHAQPSMLVHRSDHPLAGRVPTPDQRVRLGKARLGWARPTAEAAVILTVEGQPDQAVLFGYEAGAAMAGRPAPARRVGLFLDPGDAGRPGAAGWNLFDTAVDWCTAPPGTNPLNGSV